MKIRPGITVIADIPGSGSCAPIRTGDHYEAVWKYYRNRGDPILFTTTLQKPIPTMVQTAGTLQIGYLPAPVVTANTIYEHRGWLERQSDMPVGIYYAMLGMTKMG